MKKILLLLCALLGTVGTWAQVTSITDGGLYNIAFNKNGWYFSSAMKTTNTAPGDFRFDQVGANTYTIYSVGAEKYLKWDSPSNGGTPTLVATLEDTDNFKWTASYNSSTWTIATTGESVFYLNGWTNTLSESNDVKFFNNATHELSTLKIYKGPTDVQKAAYTKAAAWAELITSTSTGLMSSTNQWVSEAADASEGWLDRLTDGDLTNYFHSDWHGSYSGTHYIEATLPDATNSLLLYYYTRSTGTGCPKNITVSGSTDGTNWDDNLVTINEADMPQAASKPYVTKGLTFTSAYSHFRFYVHSTNSGSNSWFCLAEANLYQPTAAQAEAMTLAHIAAKDLTNEQIARIDALDTELRSTTVNVTYELYESDGTTLVSSETVVQEKNSAVNVPSAMTASTYFSYTTEGTIGTEDCTIKVTRTPQTGIVYPLTNLSNNKSYYIYTKNQARGGLSTYEDNGTKYLASPVKSALSISAKKFAIISYEGNYYLYSVDDAGFVTYSANQRAPLAATVTGTADAVAFTQTTAPLYEIMFDGSTNKIFNSSSSYTYGMVFNTWGSSSSEWDDGCQYTIEEADDFDPTDALAALEGFFHPAYTLTYVVKDANGATIFTSEAQPTTLGTQITTLPAEYQRDFCTYNNIDITVSNTETIAEFTATYEGLPFTISTDYDNATWYYMNGHASYNDRYISTNGTNIVWSQGNGLGDAYRWAFMGSPYALKLVNKANGAEYFLMGTNPATMGTTAKGWTLKKQTNTSWASGENGFGLYDDDLTYLNTQGSTLKYWGQFDQGSTYWVEEVPTNWASYVEADIKPWFDNNGNFFELKSSVVSENQSKYDDALTNCSYETYLELKALITEPTNYAYPGTGYYRIKSSGARSIGSSYIGYGQPTSGTPGLITVAATNAASDFSTVIKLTGSDGSYTISTEGVYVQNQTNSNTAFPATADAAEAAAFAFIPYNTPGVTVITSDGDDYGYFHEAGWTVPAVVRWTAAADASHWTVESADNITVTISDAGYATLYVPFAVEIPSGVKAYTATTNGTDLTLSEITGTIPAGTAVILEGNEDDYTFAIDATNTDEAITSNLVGNYLASTAPVDSYVLQKQGEVVGFYKVAGAAKDIKANRAYLAVPSGSEVKAFVLGDTATGINSIDNGQLTMGNEAIFNLAGQRVEKAQRGIYIKNGKKVVVK